MRAGAAIIHGMHPLEIKQLAKQLLAGEMTLEEFVTQLRPSAIELGTATIDLDRRRRCGYAEVVFGEGKSVDTLTKIFHTLLEGEAEVLATRISAEKATELTGTFADARYNELGQTLRIWGRTEPPKRIGKVAVVTAGTSDLAVAEEARETLDWMGTEALMVMDVGVAGPQRLLGHIDALSKCDAVVVVAGMEGALPSVVGGYLACPIIAVPTSVGYGASFSGVAALLGMLNSCVANVAVVNIDAGFKAAYIAGMIARRQREDGK